VKPCTDTRQARFNATQPPPLLELQQWGLFFNYKQGSEMLKLTYTDAGLHMDLVAIPCGYLEERALEMLVTQRVVLALRLGQTLHIEPSSAAFLLPANTLGLNQLQLMIRMEKSRVSVTSVDAQFVEVSVHGNWIAASDDAHEGMFITAFSGGIELLIYKLWQATQNCASSLTE
jgi:hypothetical protein